MIFWIAISFILLAGYSALMLFYFIGWKRTQDFSVDNNLKPKTKVSVLIAARNEEEHIGNCILSLLQQDYPKELYEIIVIDDHSEDKTLETLQKFIQSLRVPITEPSAIALERSNPFIQSGYNSEIASPRLSAPSLAVVSRNDANRSFKKQAIELGIRNSTGDLIITTDADCIAENKWISTVVSYYEKHHPVMIASPVAFIGEGGLLEKWQSLDLCGMMAITAGAITNRFPNMCNGANLAYEKKVFEEVGGFSEIDKQPSGDDVMLMMKIAKKYASEVHFLKAKEAIVFTQTEKTWNGLFQQRLRWLSKGTTFPDWKVSSVLVFSWLFNVSILINFLAGFFVQELWFVTGIAFLMKTVVELPLLWSGCSFFEKQKLIVFVLPAQFLHILYVVIVGGMSRFYKYTWRGRTYSNR